MTIAEVSERAQRLLASTSDAPHLDVERLLLHVLGHDETSWLHAHSDEVLTKGQQTMLMTLVNRRATGEPLAYILGSAEFYGRKFMVNQDVLIPRPETEALLATALERIATFAVRPEPYVIADVGTGSGCIAVTLALELREATSYKLLATDISEAALVVAKENAEQYGASDQIEFLQGDMLEPLQGRQVDFIISNPPYVPTNELSRAHSKSETKGLTYEPQIALDGGNNGLRYVDTIKNSGIPAAIETINGSVLLAA